MRRLLIALIACATCACAAPTDEDEDTGESADELGATDVTAFNHPTKHYAVSVKLAGKDRSIYDRTGNVLYAKKLRPFYEGGVRIQRNDDIRVGGKRFYWMWGDGDAAIPSGFVSEDELASPPTHFDDDENGHSVPIGRQLRVAPAPVSKSLRYCRLTPKGAHPNESIETQDFSDYALPGASFGRTDYAALAWNLVNVTGGGLNRATMHAGEPFHVGRLGGKEMFVTFRVVVAGPNGTAGACHYDGSRHLVKSKSAYAPLTDAYVKFVYGAVGHDARSVFGWALYETKEPGKPAVRHLMDR
jgi:hypothetical protein